jgi:hypothetical protein
MADEWRIPFDEFAANLTRIFERLRRTDETLLVETDEETIVVQRAAVDHAELASSYSFAPTPADYEEFRAAAGSWSDVDTDELIKHIYAGRVHVSDRPPIKL